ncbi:hypothetical protein PR048_005112 [Dryococelus australis]|uniref:HTH CENPB-type domain-containing protein n=1 Tax=Dryococelus australis TaxID=614101 RepID=A0ABQ9I7A4_9NEOP|nr:hypothetical protein PR048_005112 [Dryococelus australis]
MIAAIEDVKAGFSIKKAAKNNRLPRNTLSDQIKGKTPAGRKMGPDSCLTKEDEEMLVEWQLAKELNREFPFKDGRPGRKWCQSFRRRNPGLTLRTPQNLTVSCAAVTQEKIASWFEEVGAYLKGSDIETVLTNPQRIFNANETAFFLNPKGSKIIARKGDKTLLPNATHILQPMDVGVFRPLKNGSKKPVHEWRIQTRKNFGQGEIKPVHHSWRSLKWRCEGHISFEFWKHMKSLVTTQPGTGVNSATPPSDYSPHVQPMIPLDVSPAASDALPSASVDGPSTSADVPIGNNKGRRGTKKKEERKVKRDKKKVEKEKLEARSRSKFDQDDTISSEEDDPVPLESSDEWS